MHGVLASDAADPAFAPEQPRPVVRGRRPGLAGRGPRAHPHAQRGGARAPARTAPRRQRRQGDPPARRLPPRPGAVGPRRLARARLRGRARPPAGRAPPQEHAAARRRGHAALVRLRGRDGPRRCGAPGSADWERDARAAFLSGYCDRDRRLAPAARRRAARGAARGLRAGEGALRAALRAGQPARLAARAGRGHPPRPR